MNTPKSLTRFWYFYLFIYFGFVLFNLDRIPVAWLDETFGLDPAINLVRNGEYVSKIWAHPGTETKFLAYLPFIQLYNAAFLSFLPAEIYFVRLPYVLAFVVALVFLWKIYRNHLQLGLLASIVITAVFMNDKGIYESLRSFRSEVLELMLLAPAIYFFLQNKKPVLMAFLLSMVFLTHPSLWVLVGILMLYVFFKSDIKTKLISSIVFFLPILGFLVYAGFDFAALKSQLIDHGGEHMAGGNLFIDHFWNRYWPYYKLQPWVPFLNLFITGYCIYILFKEKSIKNHPLEVAFLLTSLYWLFILAPMYRYNTPNILLMFILLPKPLLLLKEKYYDTVTGKYKLRLITWGLVAILPLAILVELPFLSRNALAVIQREERNPYKALAWLDAHFGNNKKILLVENSIAHYYKIQHENVDFALVYSVYKYNFNEYDEVYQVTVGDSIPPGAALIDTYLPQKGTLGGKDIGASAVTYYGLKLIKINTPEQMKQLQRGYEQYANPSSRN
ncbi:MAG TPA: hypothetical protein VEC12_08490 [Bacteroidia bacterium]|nr:hypothetical protein [Bacteroidia bacterium]